MKSTLQLDLTGFGNLSGLIQHLDLTGFGNLSDLIHNERVKYPP
jgi:hypothetical protein